MLWLKQSGIARFHLSEVIRRKASFSLREVVKENNGLDGSFTVLGLTPLGAGFSALIVGLLASIIVFFYELKQAADSRSIREVFRDIQKKREIYKSSTYKRKYPKEAELIDYNSRNKCQETNFDLFVIKSAGYTASTEFARKYNDKIFHNNFHNK